MKNISKSPLNLKSKTLSAQSTLKSPRKPLLPSNKAFTQLTNKQIYHCTAYKKVMGQLLTQENLEQFLAQALKYVSLKEEYICNYDCFKDQSASSQNQFSEFGKALIKDGSFIVKYCKLLLKTLPQKAIEIKQYFFEAYKDKINVRKGYFDVYFKEEIYVQREETITRSYSKSPKKGKRLNQQEMSLKRQIYSSQKKMVSSLIKSNSCKKYSGKKECHSVIDIHHEQYIQVHHQQSIQVHGQAVGSQQQKITHVQQSFSSSKRILICHKSQQEEENSHTYFNEDNMSQFPLVSTRRREKEGSSKKQIRAIENNSDGKSVSRRADPTPGSQIIKLHSNEQSNKKLQQIYQSIKKQSAKKQHSSSVQSPVFRSPIKPILDEWNKKAVHQMDQQILSKINTAERSLAIHFPNVTKVAFKKYVQCSQQAKIGIFQGRIVFRCLIHDQYRPGQPQYQAVYLSDTLGREKETELSRRKMESIQVLLVEQFSIDQVYGVRKEFSFGK